MELIQCFGCVHTVHATVCIVICIVARAQGVADWYSVTGVYIVSLPLDHKLDLNPPPLLIMVWKKSTYYKIMGNLHQNVLLSCSSTVHKHVKSKKC
jgi:hypothetical protein